MTEDFIVRRTWWVVELPKDDSTSGTTRDVVVECEFAVSPMSSESHKRSVEMYANHGKVAKEFDDSA